MKKIEKLNNLKESFATVLWSIIISDEVVSTKERKEFNTFFKREFSLNLDEIDILFEQVEEGSENLDKHLTLLREAFNPYPAQKAHFMQVLNRCILCDGVDNREYATFEEIRRELF